ncbi:MAG: ATP-grasp domain-containing protein [Acidobacteria bacterium]|nr:ATP-grasp domain-containing protein [Acidobacteriota bacterium]
MPQLERVLISNRGEIAIRIVQAASSLGMESVGVYPAADSLSLHTRLTTSAVEIGNGTPDDAVAAYLDAEALVTAARGSGCDCVHPGYGFLAESAAFAQRCAEAGLVFVGPPPAALSLFGDKVRSRQLAASLDIPVVPGSDGPTSSPADAADLAARLGYPVMLKAAAGGGGRGMRRVASAEALTEAFARCRSEAKVAFGTGALFVEKLIERPRHIEVQVLADHEGNVVHLHERDCSVQLRNQKVIETAPAPGLDGDLKDRILADAVKLVAAAGYSSAGTVEFLVVPETGEHFFIECNARIQVEHTVTEQVTGIDLVEAQFRIASGATLASLGLGDQNAVGAPRGSAVQARVVARGGGTLSAYKEPTGPGVRVDGCGYVGYAPPPQFDPLLAKVIAASSSSFGSGQSSYVAAIDRLLRALGEFHIGGLATNLGQLQAILAHAAVRAGDARTTLLAEHPDLLSPAADADGNGALTLLRQQATLIGVSPAGGAGTSTDARSTADDLEIRPGQQAVECPMAGSILEIRVAQGDRVAAGEPLLIVSAMKMESQVAAATSGTVAALQPLQAGDTVAAGQVVAVIAPDEGALSETQAERRDDSWAPQLEDVATMQALAHKRLAPSSDERGVVRQRSRGKLTCRERIDLLLDDGSFHEIGSIAGFASYDDEGAIVDFTPANHVGGWGRIDGRTAVVCADDFTSRGGHADGAIGEKSRHLDRLALEMRVPSLRLLDGSSGGGSVAAMVPQQKKEGESKAKESRGAIKAGRPRVAGAGGSFLPGHLGSTMYTEQLSTVPVVNLLLGSVVGIGAAKAVLGHFSVMVRDIAQLFVAGPPVVRPAMGYDITKEDLGGWHIHCRNGSVDNLAETEEEAMALTRRFLSYLPSSVFETPPVAAPDANDPVDRRDEELFSLIPRKRTATFDVRRAIRLMADRDSFFEIGPLWGTDQVTGFVRMNGHPMGVIASDSQHTNGGALTADGCRKLSRHLDLCDLFHLPVLNLVDNPGFAVGLEHEITGTIRWGGQWMVAFSQVTVPIFTVIMRRSFGVAGNNYATPRAEPSMRVAWPAADTGGIPPEGGIEAAYKRQLAEAEDPRALRDELMARIEGARGPVGPLSRFQIEEMIDPRDTRRMICEWLETAWKIVSQSGRLRPRPIQFRP